MIGQILDSNTFLTLYECLVRSVFLKVRAATGKNKGAPLRCLKEYLVQIMLKIFHYTKFGVVAVRQATISIKGVPTFDTRQNVTL